MKSFIVRYMCGEQYCDIAVCRTREQAEDIVKEFALLQVCGVNQGDKFYNLTVGEYQEGLPFIFNPTTRGAEARIFEVEMIWQAKKKYWVRGDHSVLARPDKVVRGAKEAQAFARELERNGFENVTVE
jgi:hypothetical protein